MPKDANEAEIERQKSAMIGRGAGHNEINDPNARAEFARTGKTQGEHKTPKGKSSGCLLVFIACGALMVAGATSSLLAEQPPTPNSETTWRNPLAGSEEVKEEDPLIRWKRMRAKGNPKLEQELEERLARDRAKKQQKLKEKQRKKTEYDQRMLEEEQKRNATARRRRINSEISFYLSEQDKSDYIEAIRDNSYPKKYKNKPVPPIAVLNAEAQQELERRIGELPSWPAMEKAVAGQTQRFRHHARALHSSPGFSFHDPVLVVGQMIGMLDQRMKYKGSGAKTPVVTHRFSSFTMLLFRCMNSEQHLARCISDDRLRAFVREVCLDSSVMKHKTVFYRNYKPVQATESQKARLNVCLNVVAKNFVGRFHEKPMKESSRIYVNARTAILLDFRRHLESQGLMR